jgi:hypothetical protein
VTPIKIGNYEDFVSTTFFYGALFLVSSFPSKASKVIANHECHVFHSSQCVILQKKDGCFCEKPAFEKAVYTKVQTRNYDARSIGWSGVSEASSAINYLCICSGLWCSAHYLHSNHIGQGRCEQLFFYFNPRKKSYKQNLHNFQFQWG